MIYVWMGIYTPIMPTPKGNIPMIGTIQNTCLSAVQPYQKKLIGRMQAKMIIVGRRISGSNFPPFFAVAAETIRSFVKAIIARPPMKPKPIPRYASPERPTEKPYVLVKTLGIVVKKR